MPFHQYLRTVAARCLRVSLVLWGLGGGLPSSAAELTPPVAPALILVIDDLGNNLAAGRRALALPGPLAYAILPHTPHARRLAQEAHRRHKTVMLHAPMENLIDLPLGPGALKVQQDRQAFLQTLRTALDATPHVQGVNNHMGSLLTQLSEPMGWLMQELKQRRLFFVDSRTTPFSQAAKQAAKRGVPYLSRHVFLDNERHPAAIDRAFRHLLERARSQGYAVGIGHPYPETLAYLERALPQLARQGIRVVSISQQLMALQRAYPEQPLQLTAQSPAPLTAARQTAPAGSRPGAWQPRPPAFLQEKRLPAILQPITPP